MSIADSQDFHKHPKEINVVDVAIWPKGHCIGQTVVHT